jgi:hypothetical protein
LQVSILKKHSLPDIPSDSGVEVVNNVIYMVGNNLSWLNKLDYQMKLTNKIALFASPDLLTQIFIST